MPSSHPFVPIDFAVPAELETADYRLRMLTVNDVVKDFDAVMSSAAELAELWPMGSWPRGLTLEQNLIDLGWHQKEFQRRSSFAYTVVALDESAVLGCVYLYPTRKRGYDVIVSSWFRETTLGEGADAELFSTVTDWVTRHWSFVNPAYPGRVIPWGEWSAIPEEKA